VQRVVSNPCAQGALCAGAAKRALRAVVAPGCFARSRSQVPLRLTHPAPHSRPSSPFLPPPLPPTSHSAAASHALLQATLATLSCLSLSPIEWRGHPVRYSGLLLALHQPAPHVSYQTAVENFSRVQQARPFFPDPGPMWWICPVDLGCNAARRAATHSNMLQHNATWRCNVTQHGRCVGYVRSAGQMQGEFRTLKESLEAEKQLVLEVGSLRPCILHPACVPTTIRAVVARLFPALPSPALPCPPCPPPALPSRNTAPVAPVLATAQ
jgi:hypothetical protein